MLTRNTSFFKKLIIVITLGLTCLNSIADDEQKFECGLRYITEPPFWVVTGDSSVLGHEYDNLKGPEHKNYKELSRNNQFAISKRSIVLKDPDRPTVYHGTNNQEYIPVIVASTPKDKRAEKKHIANSINRYESTSRKVRPTTSKRAEVGTKGYIFGGTLKREKNKILRVNPSLMPPGTIKENIKNGQKLNDYIFVVKKDTVVTNIPGVDDFNQDYSLKLKTSDGKYMVNFCTDPKDSENIKIKYLFDVKKLNENGNPITVSYLQLDPNSECSEDFLSSLIPIQENIYRPLISMSKVGTNNNKGIENILYLEGLKLSQFPQGEIKKIGDQCYTEGPYDSFHYIGSTIGNCKGSYANREQNSDSLLKPHAACAMMGALKNIKKRCPGCSTQWGDSFWPKGRHRTHDSGTCVDFRPLKPNGGLGANNIAWGKENYSESDTKVLVEEMIKAGANKIIFNDLTLDDDLTEENKSTVDYSADSSTKSEIRAGKKKRIPVKLSNRVHSNHLHICFTTDERSIVELTNKKNSIEAKKLFRKADKLELKELTLQIKRKQKMNKSCAENLKE